MPRPALLNCTFDKHIIPITYSLIHAPFCIFQKVPAGFAGTLLKCYICPKLLLFKCIAIVFYSGAAMPSLLICHLTPAVFSPPFFCHKSCIRSGRVLSRHKAPDPHDYTVRLKILFGKRHRLRSVRLEAVHRLDFAAAYS